MQFKPRQTYVRLSRTGPREFGQVRCVERGRVTMDIKSVKGHCVETFMPTPAHAFGWRLCG